MKTPTLLIAAVLLAGPACSRQEPTAPQQDAAARPAAPAAGSQAAPAPPPKADVQGSEGEKMKGYGYGTPSGREAAEGSAEQATQAPATRTPQQEEGTASSTDEGSSGAAAPQGSQQQGSHVQGGTAPTK